MAFGSFFTRALDVITPWNRGGEVQRRQERKKREEQQWARNTYKGNSRISVGVASRGPEVSVEGQDEPKPKQPENIFETLNKNLVFNKPQNAVPILNNQDNQPTEPPKPGVVVTPTVQTPKISGVTTAPAQNLRAVNSREVIKPAPGFNTKSIIKPRQTPANRFIDIFDANTEADKFRRSQEAQQELMKRGVSPVFAQRAIEQSPDALRRNNLFPTLANFTKDAIKSAARGTKTVVTTPIESARSLVGSMTNNKAAEQAAEYRKNRTFYGKEVADRLAQGENVKFGDTAMGALDVLAVLPLLKGGSMLASGAKESLANRSAFPVVKGALNAFDEAFIGLKGILTRRPKVTPEETENIDNLLSEADIADINTTNIPVKKGVEIAQPVSEPVNIPVRNANKPTPLIQEIGGDARTATTNAAAAKKALNARRVEAAKRADTGLPDRSIDGVTPRAPEKPFSMTPDAAATNQDQIVKDYAETLRGLGEGNGTQLVLDGEGGYFRTSNNVRSAENKGKRMTKADWEDEARKQLESGQAEQGHQQAFNDAKDPEVQSLLNQGEQVPAPEGRPITVKQARGIDVIDQTNVPQNLPETPGKVRVTKATEPMNAKSEAVAAEAPPAPKQTGFNPDGSPRYDTNRTFETGADGTTKVKPGPSPAENFPAPNESDEVFLKRLATDMQSNIERAVTSLKATKKMTKAQRAQRAAEGEKAYQEAKAAGKSIAEQEAARKAAYAGSFDRMDYSGSPIHSADEQRLRDMVDEHYKDMPYQAGNVREAFSKLFHAGEPGYHSEAGNHIIPSDIKNIRKFLNESVPNADGNGGLGDFAESAIKELAATEKGPGKIANAIGLQRALRFTMDISATGRQALPAALSHPTEFAKAVKKSFEVMFSHKNYQKFVSELANNKEANYINDRLGAYLSVINDDISKADDIYRNSAWAHKIPVVKQVVAASERQYNTLLSMMRYQGGKRFIDAAGGIGELEKIASESGNADEFLKAIGTVTNINTGRGQIGNLGADGSKILGNILVSPRGLAARIQRFNPKYYNDLAKVNPEAAKEAVRSMAIQTGVTLSALGAASKAGLYEDGQIKIGNTRYDITGGAANMVRTAVRVAQYINGNRETSPFNNAESEVTRWARNQLAPFVSSSLNAIGIHQDPKSGTWVNRWGEDVTLASTVLDNFVPVNISQVASDMKQGVSGAQTAINAGLNTLGIGVNTYESSADKQLPKDKSARDVYKQLQKDKISTSSSDISTYISDGDYEKAKRAAEYNVMAAKAEESPSNTKIKKAEQVLREINLRQEGVPMTDDGITATIENGEWDKAIKGYESKIEKARSDGELSKKTEKSIQDDIERVRVVKDNNFTPELFSSYKDTSLSEWRKMGDPESEDYNPDMYQQLWEIDQKMTDKKVSDKEGNSEKPKYSAKEPGKGRRGRSGSGQRAIDTSFGTLKTGTGAPTVQEYASIDAKAGNVPVIRKVRPNIVHNISSSG